MKVNNESVAVIGKTYSNLKEWEKFTDERASFQTHVRMVFFLKRALTEGDTARFEQLCEWCCFDPTRTSKALKEEMYTEMSHKEKVFLAEQKRAKKIQSIINLI